MFSQKTQDIASLYTKRHETRGGVFGEAPHANYGYWTREGMTIDEACESLTGAAGIGPGDRVLDVGCGYAAGSVHIMKSRQPTSILGIDATDVRIETARQYIEKQGLADKIAVQVGDATALDFGDGSFSKLIAIECAFHFNTRRDFLREAARVLAPGGGLGMSDIILRKGADPQEFRERVNFAVVAYCRLDFPENVYDADGYADLLRSLGFEEVRIDAITDQTLPPFIVHLERVARQSRDEKGARRLRAAQIYREYISLGLEYVLVSARKPKR
jgi:ubiquinone/menaquinone biosynthesis C-methylase UbiE